MNTKDWITDFKLRTDFYETPMGTFECSELARQACIKNDLEPALVTVHTVEMATIQSLLKAINGHCGALAEEYDFKLDCDLIPETGYKSKPGRAPSRIPECHRWLIAFAVEGGSEGYYVHVGALLDSAMGNNERQFLQFGLAKTNTSENAFELAKQVQRFLCAAVWN